MLHQIKATTGTCQKEVASAYDLLKEKLGKARERMMQSLADQQDEMITTLTKAVTDSVTKHKSIVQSFFDEMTAEVDTSYESTTETLGSIEGAADVGKSQLSSMQQEHDKAAKKAEKAAALATATGAVKTAETIES